MSPVFLALLLTAALAGLQGTLGIRTKGTSFPWEGCKQGLDTGLYRARFESYFQAPRARGWTMCWRIEVRDQAECLANAAESGIRDRCCDTGLNKFRVWPAFQCRNSTHQSIASVTLDGVRMSRFTWDYFNNSATRFEPEWALKITPLRLNATTAQNYQICINLRPPCETMAQFAANGRWLEWALYDVKRDNYECCPAGYSTVQHNEYPRTSAAAIERTIVPGK